MSLLQAPYRKEMLPRNDTKKQRKSQKQKAERKAEKEREALEKR